MSITHLADALYAEPPEDLLYHYTSLEALTKIVESGCLYATDVQFFSDASERKHTADILRGQIARQKGVRSSNSTMLSQLLVWVSERLTRGHMQFVASFSTDGNLLSQWRSYCPQGKGVSIGFRPEVIIQAARAQEFHIGKCIYDGGRQQELAKSILSKIEEAAERLAENTDTSKRHPSQSFHDVFEEVEGDLLRIAALIKHESFNEEKEWRVVSSIITDYVQAPIKYREGRSMLIPFIEFSLRANAADPLPFEHVILGPTPNPDSSQTSLSRFLSKYGANPKNGVLYCQIPYREH